VSFSIMSVSYQRRVKTFPGQRRTVGGVVFYVVRVLSNERRRLVLPRTLVFVCEMQGIVVTVEGSWGGGYLYNVNKSYVKRYNNQFSRWNFNQSL
jgi:hypothetical protein